MFNTWPNEETLIQVVETLPVYMYPNDRPWLITAPGYLTTHQCHEIINEMEKQESFSYRGCGGETRECPQPLHEVLDPIKECVAEANVKYWRYIYNSRGAAWFQTYKEGAQYEMHMDGSPGQSRKLTAIAILTNPLEYDGGQLSFYGFNKWYDIDQPQGTIVILPPWMMHQVSEVTRGVRQTINMGFWGPPFK